jgi:hypothetical protein
MRKSLTALVMVSNVGLWAWGVSAGPTTPTQFESAASNHQAAIQKADWYCGPHCQYWRHRRWEERHWHGYGYDHPYGYGGHYSPYRYGYNYPYNHYYRYGY